MSRRPREAIRPSEASPAAMTDDELAQIIERTCTNKRRYLNPGAARGAAFSARARSGLPINPYRCPFGDGTRANAHWHIGRIPSFASLKRMAAAIRHRAQSVV